MTDPEHAARVAVVGLGNVLIGDDAVGPTVLERLKATWTPPPGVRFLEAGTPGLDLTPFVAGLEALIVVDTIRADGRPGAVQIHERDAILHQAPLQAISPHEPGLREALLTLELSGEVPARVWLVGVIPASVATGIGLSPAVSAAIPELEARVVTILADELGITLTAREPPRAPDLWWERAPS